MSFDHGAQYIIARSPAFQAVIADLAIVQAVAPWLAGSEGGETRWVGVPAMSSLPRAMAEELTAAGTIIHRSRHVGALHTADGNWQVRHFAAEAMLPGALATEGGDPAGPFSAVVLALPAPQARTLLEAAGHAHASTLAGVKYAPCWAAIATFEARLDAPDFARPSEGPLGWLARQGSRPARAGHPDAWVMHATPAWSRDHLERDPGAVATDLLAAMPPGLPAPSYLSAHRWRYALVERALGQSHLWDAAARIGVCGDFCLGPRVEAAWQSGAALASAVLSLN